MIALLVPLFTKNPAIKIGMRAIFMTPKDSEPRILATKIVPAPEMKVVIILPTIRIILPLAEVWIISENFFSKPFLHYFTLSSDKEYYLLFDQLDIGWDFSDETKQLLIGLILAARDVVRAAEGAGKQVHVVVFLRSDIYEPLRFEDKNKISPSVVELRWNEQRLRELVSKRIDASANGTWEDVFTGDQMRSRVSQLSYIVKRTMLRPRDMIQFCVHAKTAAIELRAYPKTSFSGILHLWRYTRWNIKLKSQRTFVCQMQCGSRSSR